MNASDLQKFEKKLSEFVNVSSKLNDGSAYYAAGYFQAIVRQMITYLPKDVQQAYVEQFTDAVVRMNTELEKQVKAAA